MTPAVAVVEPKAPTKEKEWSAQQKRFQMWLALPVFARFPDQQIQLAKVMKVDESTLCKWKHRPGFGDEVVRLAQELVKADDISQILHGIARHARAGDVKAAEFIFRVAGLLPSVGDSIHFGDNVVNTDMKVIEVLGALPPGQEGRENE